MNRSRFYTAVLLLLVLVIAVLGFLIVRRKAPEEPTPTPDVSTAAETLPPREDGPSASPATETPTPTEEPVFETRPPVETQPPEETPEPSPTPKPEAQGSCTSSTGTGLNIRVEWHTLPGGDQLQVDVYSVSYSIFSAAQWQSVQLTLGERTYTSDSKAISYDGQDQVTQLLSSFTVDAPAAGTPISVTWHYKGSYSGKELSAITASGTVSY